jgi:hypothetical protein
VAAVQGLLPKVATPAGVGCCGADLGGSFSCWVGWQVSRDPASGIPAGGLGHGGPRRGYTWPPFTDGNTAALQHGAKSPRMLQPVADRLAEGLGEVAPWTSAPVFAGSVASWAHAEAQAYLLRQYLDDHGLVDDEGQPRPASRMLEQVEGRLAGLRAQLGLTPLALGKLLATLSQVDGDKGAEGLEALRRAGAELRAAADQRVIEGNGCG